MAAGRADVDQDRVVGGLGRQVAVLKADLVGAAPQVDDDPGVLRGHARAPEQHANRRRARRRHLRRDLVGSEAGGALAPRVGGAPQPAEQQTAAPTASKSPIACFLIRNPPLAESLVRVPVYARPAVFASVAKSSGSSRRSSVALLRPPGTDLGKRHHNSSCAFAHTSHDTPSLWLRQPARHESPTKAHLTTGFDRRASGEQYCTVARADRLNRALEEGFVNDVVDSGLGEIHAGGTSRAADGRPLQFLSDATLEILADIGVLFPSRRALDLFADHGADVDESSGRVRISAELVAQALSTAPRSFVLAGREERLDLRLDGNATYVCTEGVGTRVIDLDTGQARSSRKDDVAMMARVVDALPLIGFFWPPVSAQDFPSTAPLHECHAGLTNTLKHVRGGTTMHPLLARSAVEMATVLAGSPEARRRRPPICANICTVSPLAQDPVGIEAALIYAEAGIPLSFMAMSTAGSTAPASMLGALVQGEAEVVSALVLMQLAHPGCPVMHSNYVSLMDPRSGGYLSEVPFHFEPVVSQLSHVAWGVPDLGGASLSSDSSDIDWVSGLRAGTGAALLAERRSRHLWLPRRPDSGGNRTVSGVHRPAARGTDERAWLVRGSALRAGRSRARCDPRRGSGRALPGSQTHARARPRLPSLALADRSQEGKCSPASSGGGSLGVRPSVAFRGP